MDQSNAIRRTMLQSGWAMALVAIALIILGVVLTNARLLLTALALAAGAAVSVAALPEPEPDQPVPNEGPGILRDVPADFARFYARRSSVRSVRAGR